jgi:hypothetical protein
MNSPERLPLVCVNEDSGTEQPEVVLDPEDARSLGLALVQAAVESRAVRIVLPPEVTPGTRRASALAAHRAHHRAPRTATLRSWLRERIRIGRLFGRQQNAAS